MPKGLRADEIGARAIWANDQHGESDTLPSENSFLLWLVIMPS